MSKLPTHFCTLFSDQLYGNNRIVTCIKMPSYPTSLFLFTTHEVALVATEPIESDPTLSKFPYNQNSQYQSFVSFMVLFITQIFISWDNLGQHPGHWAPHSPALNLLDYYFCCFWEPASTASTASCPVAWSSCVSVSNSTGVKCQHSADTAERVDTERQLLGSRSLLGQLLGHVLSVVVPAVQANAQMRVSHNPFLK